MKNADSHRKRGDETSPEPVNTLILDEASRTAQECSAVVLSHRSVVICYSSPGTLIHLRVTP